MLVNYRKSFLYYTDETWAEEGKEGFFAGNVEGLGSVAMGICQSRSSVFFMFSGKRVERGSYHDFLSSHLTESAQIPGMDINPYRFIAPWTEYEFANHALAKSSSLILLTMAWLDAESRSSPCSQPGSPDLQTLSYWLDRFKPLIEANGETEVLVALCNRWGNEGNAYYAGTSAVLGVRGGEVIVYGILGQAEEKLLLVDTTKVHQARGILRFPGR